MDYQAALKAVESLPVDEQVRLVEEVQGRLIESADDFELTDELKDELNRRIEEMDRNPDSGIPWQVVHDRLIKRFGR